MDTSKTTKFKTTEYNFFPIFKQSTNLLWQYFGGHLISQYSGSHLFHSFPVISYPFLFSLALSLSFSLPFTFFVPSFPSFCSVLLPRFIVTNLTAFAFLSQSFPWQTQSSPPPHPTPPQLSKTVNEVYHMYNKNQYPFVLLNVETSAGGHTPLYTQCTYVHVYMFTFHTLFAE